MAASNLPVPALLARPGIRGRTFAAFFACYLFLDWVSYVYPVQQSAITPWNPHPALAIGLLALGGQRWLPAVALAILASEVLIRQMPAGLAVTLLVSIVLALGYGGIAAALRNVLPAAGMVESTRELGRFVAVVMIGSLVTGTLYVGALAASGAMLPAPYFEALAQFWIGDCVGVLVTLPVLLVLVEDRRRQEARLALRDPVSWLQVASIALALWLVFGPAFADPFKFFYILVLPLVWIGVRFGLLGAALAAMAIQCGAMASAVVSGTTALTVFELQALLIALAITGLFLGVSVDERRRAAVSLRESLRMAAAGEMSAALAHELNQPLAAFGAYAKAATLMAAAQPLDREALLATLAKAQGEAARAAEVVRRLRDFFRTGATRLERASLAALAASAIASIEPKARAAGVSVAQESESVPEVLVDTLQIELVLRNLLANGIEAARSAADSKAVEVRVAHGDPGFVKVMVRDSGPGVPQDLAERVFEPFWSTRPTGLGMGLAISRAIVEAHGGNLWLEKGRHGAFVFTIPSSEG